MKTDQLTKKYKNYKHTCTKIYVANIDKNEERNNSTLTEFYANRRPGQKTSKQENGNNNLSP